MKQQLKINSPIILLFGFLLLFQAAAAIAAPGDLDTTFNSTGKRRVGVGGGEDYGKAMARQSDGKLVVAGTSVNGDGSSSFSIIRYNVNGTLDVTFGFGGRVLTSIYGHSGANTVAILSDGKILAAGYSEDDIAIVKYLSSGILDPTFGIGGIVTTDLDNGTSDTITDNVNAIAVQSDGKIILGGDTKNSNPNSLTPFTFLARYTSNGALDTSFNQDGTLTGNGGSVTAVVVLSGKIYYLINGTNHFTGRENSYLVCINSDGSRNQSFNGYGGYVILSTSSSQDSRSHSLAILTAFAGEEKIIVTGETFEYTTTSEQATTYQTLWSIDANNGSVDTSFGNGGRAVLPDADTSGRVVRIQNSSGVASRIVVAGTVSGDFMVARYLLNGALDTAFNGGGSVIANFGNSNDSATAMLIQPTDNKIVVAGFSNTVTTLGTVTKVSDNDFQTVRFNTNGTLDTTFSGDGRRLDDIGDATASAEAVAVQSDGKIIVAGDKSVARFNSDGSFDTTFGENGKIKIPFGSIRAAVIQPDGKIVLAAEFSQSYFFVVYRLNANGTLDTTFDNDGIAIVKISSNSVPKAMAIQPDGKIVVAGYTNLGSNYNPQFVIALARLLTNGSLDPSFNYGNGISVLPSGSSVDRGNSVAIQPDGKIIVAGNSTNGLDKDFAIFRFTANGLPDNSFDSDGKQTVDFGSSDDVANAVAIQSGKIIVAGYAHVNITDDFAVVRLNSNGTLDNSFDGDGKTTTPIGNHNDVGNAVAVQTDGKILVAGSGESAASVNDFAIVRYNADGSLDNSYGSGGKVTIDFGGNDTANAIALDSSSRAVVAGGANGLFGVVRLLNYLGPTAATVSVSGRVLTPAGRGLTNALVSLTDANGATRTARTSSFGYYRFEAVEVGQTYIFNVSSKRYQFAPQVITLTEDLENLNFFAGQSNSKLNDEY